MEKIMNDKAKRRGGYASPLCLCNQFFKRYFLGATCLGLAQFSPLTGIGIGCGLFPPIRLSNISVIQFIISFTLPIVRRYSTEFPQISP
jgi:hypothetical protein